MNRIAIMLFLIFVLIFTGCSKRAQPASVSVSNAVATKASVTVAQPQDAVDAIYASLKSYDAVTIGAADLNDAFDIKAASVSEYYGMISKPNDGLADVVILMPKEQERENVSLALSKYKEKRMAEFENYDILDAYAISQNAVIYEQGGYTIMLMLSDNDAARKIIDEYIPL